ncbi:MAG: DnaJ domain-containing protein [Alphaproteobacteria bacterium]|nr:DnaJ domain-containing protein [Alphaproteobacteria bacterium]
MIKKCEYPGCEKAGTCRAPKSRSLNEYHNFCQLHAAEYNKNWNYYQNMTAEEIETDWERQTFGTPLKDKKQADAETSDYLNFLNDFITGRNKFDQMPSRPTAPALVIKALKSLDLPLTAGRADARAAYRRLAKLYHPDTAKKLNSRSASAKFAEISEAYKVLEKHFKS